MFRLYLVLAHTVPLCLMALFPSQIASTQQSGQLTLS